MSTMIDSLLQYSDDLTQRLTLTVTDYPDANNNNTNKCDKYSLRPRSLRRVNDKETKPQNSVTKKQKQKQKQKSAPLSKYKRKTANARERCRMREMNAAFEALRRAVPHLHNSGFMSASTNEKLTKITTLRLAMKYISALSAALNESTPMTSSSIDFSDLLSDCNDLNCFLLESDGESLPLSEHSLLASPDFPDTDLSTCNFDDPALPSLLQTEYTDAALPSPEFNEFFLT